MSKEVTYSVVARKNMLKKDDPAKYYAQAQASGDVGLDVPGWLVRVIVPW